MRATFAQTVDEQLLVAAKARDEAALERLYRQFETPVYTLAVRLLGQPADAMDALQDAMLQAFQRLDQYQGAAPFGAWLKQIVVRTCLQRLRRQRTWLSLVPRIPSQGHSESSAATEHDIGAALQRLPATTRAVVWLYEVERYSHAEIAELFNQSISFSKSRLSRGRALLRETGIEFEVQTCLETA